MKTYLAELAKHYENALEEICRKNEDCACLDNIEGELIPGARVTWCFHDDIDFWKGERKLHKDYDETNHPEHWPYSGILIPFPETEGRGVMEAEQVCVVIVDYPIEKENPVADWVTLAQIITQEDFYKMHVFKEGK